MWPAILLIPIVAIYRVIMAWQTSTGGLGHGDHHPLATWLPGFCPLSAVALCAGAFLPRRLAVAVPLSILLASDVVIDWHYGAAFFTLAMFGRYALLALVCLAGWWMRRGSPRLGPGGVLLATVGASTFFYVASNSLTWLGSPEYPQSAGGWFQALTLGLPGYLPSWYFYRNALVSDCLYSMVFMACLSRVGVPRRARFEVPARPAALGFSRPR